MQVSLIVAMSENRVIGVENGLPWHLPEDLRHFKRVTSGHPVIMGRKTFESIGRPLPKRTNIVLTRQKDYCFDGVEVFASVEDALTWTRKNVPEEEEVFFIGGEEIFRQVLPFANRIYLTVIHKKIDGDAFFPEFDQGLFEVISQKNGSGELPHTYYLYEKKRD